MKSFLLFILLLILSLLGFSPSFADRDTMCEIYSSALIKSSTTKFTDMSSEFCENIEYSTRCTNNGCGKFNGYKIYGPENVIKEFSEIEDMFYSATITITDNGSDTDHIIIFTLEYNYGIEGIGETCKGTVTWEGEIKYDLYKGCILSWFEDFNKIVMDDKECNNSYFTFVEKMKNQCNYNDHSSDEASSDDGNNNKNKNKHGDKKNNKNKKKRLLELEN